MVDGPTHSKNVAEEPGLHRALEEMGPNPMTEFADALVTEGFEHLQGGARFEMWEDIGAFREAFTAFLVGKQHAFIGGAAARSYKARAGPTFDYDVLVGAPEAKQIYRFLDSQGAQLKERIEDTDHYRIEPLELDVDIRTARSGLDREALQQARQTRYRDRALKIVTPAHLAAMKVKAYAERKELPKGTQDRQDVLGLLCVGATTEQDVREILRRHRPDLLAHLDEILSEP